MIEIDIHDSFSAASFMIDRQSFRVYAVSTAAEAYSLEDLALDLEHAALSPAFGPAQILLDLAAKARSGEMTRNDIARLSAATSQPAATTSKAPVDASSPMVVPDRDAASLLRMCGMMTYPKTLRETTTPLASRRSAVRGPRATESARRSL